MPRTKCTTTKCYHILRHHALNNAINKCNDFP
nr:MAG TPA: hypothetical protein [Caudoviricetes sp.]